jgi:predicted Zn-dependent protease
LDLAVSALKLGEYDRALESLLTVLAASLTVQLTIGCSEPVGSLRVRRSKKPLQEIPIPIALICFWPIWRMNSHDTARALAEYEKALAIGNADPEVHLLFVQFLTRQLRVSEALEKARIAVAKFPAHSALNHELGKLLLKSGDAQQAITHFLVLLRPTRTSLRLVPNWPTRTQPRVSLERPLRK